MIKTYNKAEWRKELRSRRLSLSKEQHVAKSSKISRQITSFIKNNLSFNDYSKIIVSGYFSVGSECNIYEFMNTWPGILCFPCIEKKLDRIRFRIEKLGFVNAIQNNINIPQPNINNAECKPNIIIVPLLGYTTSGFRLGQGQGWFDKTLNYYNNNFPSSELPISIGVGFDCQKENALPVENHDQKCDVIINEKQFFIIKRNKQ